MQTIKIGNQNILVLSDTHGKHRLLDIPTGIQIIIHCGDICNAGDMVELFDFFDWFKQLEIPHKLFIHGNHDLPFEMQQEWGKRLIPKEIIWLNNASIVIHGIHIMGITPNAAYTQDDMKKEIDIIASHYPPYGILDKGYGSAEIRDFILRFTPKYHVFGHDHSSFGKIEYQNIQFINAAIYNMVCQKEKL